MCIGLMPEVELGVLGSEFTAWSLGLRSGS